MSDPVVTFAVKRDVEGVAQLEATLDDKGLDKGDIRLRFARLSMLYARQVAEDNPFAISEVSAGDTVTASIILTQEKSYGDGEQFMELGEDDDHSFFNTHDGDAQDNKSIGFRLKIGSLNSPDERPFGWAAAPAVVAATLVSKMVKTAIQQAAGVDFGAQSIEAEGLGR